MTKPVIPLEIRQAISRLVSAVRADPNEPIGWDGVKKARQALYKTLEPHLKGDEPTPVKLETEQAIREAIEAGKIVTMANPWMRVLIRADGRLYVSNVRSGIDYDWLDVDVLYCQVITPEKFKEAERDNW